LEASERIFFDHIQHPADLDMKIKIVLLGLLLAPAILRAFCGFYVAKADSKLFNKASQVVLAATAIAPCSPWPTITKASEGFCHRHSRADGHQEEAVQVVDKPRWTTSMPILRPA